MTGAEAQALAIFLVSGLLAGVVAHWLDVLVSILRGR